jgi:DegV family protein with EDD domain
MYKFDIFTDSSCDLNQDMIDQYDLKVMQLEVTIDDAEPVLNNEINVKEFYDQLRAGSMAKTNAVPLGQFEDNMRKSLDAGKDILYLGFSSGLSATYANGVMVMEDIKDDYADRKLIHYDTLSASMAQGLIVYYAALLREEGLSIEEVYQKVSEISDYVHAEVTVNDLFFLKRGGRIDAPTAIIGSVLKFKPIIMIDNEGKLSNVGKVRGRKTSIQEIFNKFKANADLDKFPYVFISQGDCLEDTDTLKSMIETEFPQAKVVIGYVGTVIGAHTGPDVIALCYLGKNKKGNHV